MSSDNSIGAFVARNKTAIIATVAAGTTAVAAYYYYSQLQQQQQQQQKGSDDSVSKKKKKNKKKKNSSSSAKPCYPIDSNGEPDLKDSANFTEEQKETYSVALKDKGNQFFKEQKYEDALKYYNYALDLKQDPVFYSNISACYVSLGNLEKVVESSTKALELKPDYSKALLRRASANENLENFAEAMFDLSVLSLNGDFNEASIEPMLERNLNKQAMRVLKDKMSSDAKQQLPSNTFLASFFGIFTPETTLKNFDESNEADVELLNALVNLYKRKSESYLIADESFSKAAESYVKQLEANPDDEVLKEKTATALEYNGIFKFLKNDPLGSHEDIQRSIELHPRVNAYIYSALIMADKGESKNYFDFFDKALDVDPNSAPVYYHRGQMHFLSQQYEKAAADFEKAKESDSSNIFPYIQLACLTYHEGKFDDCETLFSEAKRKFPTAPEVPNFYAEVLTDKGDFDAASKQYDIAKRLEESLDAIHVGVSPLVGKATLLARQPTVENLLESTTLLEEACKMDSRSEQAKIGLAQLKLQQEEIDEAITLFEEASDLARNMEEKLQATTFAEASKVQKKIRADPVVNAKIQATLAAYREQGLI
ncbi:hypothetical protein Kpol_1048p21 [Vanderwaltozyma polyspora DSM 70294]|uniref:TOM70 n=1 Tax=Vanderwaltozyma polyspora (strain ATCC 22028 / DSM 70294 / BCRC 21397 / CBS 2163 / NBRC 10782 / NRRL Y-8283 / UCD 57-17) TaxID=436907 RepID=A7TGI4_VANPO|nr:uncharacterized protein Kpol_1048p21 [Vanderwaltozyma polyspora DSM 70294]EDO18591.1 hypothetical protein Kpol_1048p21 [Vanderwaltozyma polyspora DSM 70294]